MKRLTLGALLIAGLFLGACSDDDNGNNNNVTCQDQDGDQYGVGDACKGPDCDDNDNTKWAEMQGYPDADGDGHFASTPETVCTGDSLPQGYSDQPGDDCDDANKDVWQEVQAYVDNDGDGVGAATANAETLCIGDSLPQGYSDTNTDCNDGDENAFQLVSGYPDLDGDGERASATAMACTDGSLPQGWSADTPGTDCDDHDAISKDPDNDPGCQWLGFCVDTEMFLNPPAPDLRGIGACMSTDCNGANPEVWQPVVHSVDATGNEKTCTNQDDCDGDAGEFCDGGYCWVPNPECNAGDQPCSTIPDCLKACQADHPDPSEQFPCMQQCYENATPYAQYLYWKAQDCAAAAGCFIADDVTACAMANCLPEFGACMGDTN